MSEQPLGAADDEQPTTVQPSDGAILQVTRQQLSEALRSAVIEKEAMLNETALLKAALVEENARAAAAVAQAQAIRAAGEEEVAALHTVIADLRARLGEEADALVVEGEVVGDKPGEADASAA